MKRNHFDLNSETRRTARYLFWLWLLPLSVAMVGTGCKQEANVANAKVVEAKVAADTNPAGTYSLVSVDGNKVPCTLTHEGHTLTVKSGTFIINPEGTCSSKVVFSPPSGGDASREVKATYTRRGSKLTMQWQGAGMTTGTVEADAFTMNNEGMIFAYHK
ncbi:MAG: hypothetical protein NT154_10550 [Verrucomicrobia bacterium]|nr:hypothetical protein [Verrucomicrobiota bacterium]